MLTIKSKFLICKWKWDKQKYFTGMTVLINISPTTNHVIQTEATATLVRTLIIEIIPYSAVLRVDYSKTQT